MRNRERIIIHLLLLASAVCCQAIDREPAILYETVTTSQNTYVREEPQWRAAVVEMLASGTHLLVLQEPKNRWLQVRTPSKHIGWVETRDTLGRDQISELRNLTDRVEKLPPQMSGEIIEDANLRLRPGRNTTKIARVKAAQLIDIFAMAHIRLPMQDLHKQKYET